MTTEQMDAAHDAEQLARARRIEVVHDPEQEHDCMPQPGDSDGLPSGAIIRVRDCGHAWELERQGPLVGSLCMVFWHRAPDHDAKAGQ